MLPSRESLRMRVSDQEAKTKKVSACAASVGRKAWRRAYGTCVPSVSYDVSHPVNRKGTKDALPGRPLGDKLIGANVDLEFGGGLEEFAYTGEFPDCRQE